MNTQESEEPYLWLADTYDSLPDYDPADPSAQGTDSSVDKDWRSPFIGSSVEEVAAFIQAAPKPPKPLYKQFFAVLQKEMYEQSKQVLIYRASRKESDNTIESNLESVPCPVHLVGVFFNLYDQYHWNRAVTEQALFYGEGASWDDDDTRTQLMALVVLDDIPPAVCIMPFSQSLYWCTPANSNCRPWTKSSTRTPIAPNVSSSG